MLFRSLKRNIGTVNFLMTKLTAQATQTVVTS